MGPAPFSSCLNSLEALAVECEVLVFVDKLILEFFQVVSGGSFLAAVSYDDGYQDQNDQDNNTQQVDQIFLCDFGPVFWFGTLRFRCGWGHLRLGKHLVELYADGALEVVETESQGAQVFRLVSEETQYRLSDSVVLKLRPHFVQDDQNVLGYSLA